MFGENLKYSIEQWKVSQADSFDGIVLPSFLAAK